MANTPLGAPLKESDLPENDGVLAFVTDWNKYKSNLLQGYVDVGPRPDCMGLGTMPRVQQLGMFAGTIRAAGGYPAYVVMPARELWKKYRLTKMQYGNPHFFISRSGANLRRVRYTDAKYDNRMVISEFFTTYIIEAIFEYIQYIARGQKNNVYMKTIDTTEDTAEVKRLMSALNISDLDGSLELTAYQPDGFKTPAFNRLVLRIHEEIFRLDIKNVGQLTRALWPLVDEFMTETLRSNIIPCNTAHRHVDSIEKCRQFGFLVARLWAMMSDRLQWRMLYGGTYAAINMQSDFTAEQEYIIQPNRRTCQLHLEFPPGTVIIYPRELGTTAPETAAATRLAKTRGVFIFDSLGRGGMDTFSPGQLSDAYQEMMKFPFYSAYVVSNFADRTKYSSGPNEWMDWVRSQNY